MLLNEMNLPKLTPGKEYWIKVDDNYYTRTFKECNGDFGVFYRIKKKKKVVVSFNMKHVIYIEENKNDWRSKFKRKI